MNPNENNPAAPTDTSGAMGGGSSIPSPVDFTGADANSDSGLSMTDSLASAQDNLTSAGQAAPLANNATDINHLEGSNAATSMETPIQPLTPAAPVPGSIGSVTSVPPAPAEPVDTSMLSGNTTPVQQSTTSAMPVMGGGAAKESNSGNTAPAAGSSNTPVQPYYNPFARTGGNMNNATSAAAPATQQSSATVPPALQPQMEKFSSGAGKKGISIMSVLAWVLVVVLAGTTALFAIMWRDAEERAAKKEIIYLPAEGEDNPGGEDSGNEDEPPVAGTVTTLSCSQNVPLDGSEGDLQGLISQDQVMRVGYTDGNMTDIATIVTMNFTDHDAAEAAKTLMDEQGGILGMIGAMTGIASMTSSSEVVDSALNYTVTANVDDVTGEGAAIFGLTVAEDGSVDKSLEVVRAGYEAAGFVCVTE